jgi:hypothetical protein
MQMKLQALFTVLLIAGCSNSAQFTSGKEFLAGGLPISEADIAKAAAVEPDLRFPARIGVARVVNGDLTGLPAEEAQLFAGLTERKAMIGEFIPVSPLVVSMMQADQPPEKHTIFGRSTEEIVHAIRLGAARQHLDYVLIYEAGAQSTTGNTPFALADVTLIGGVLLPTRSIKVAGIGQALLIDVRNGYPYGTANVAVELKGLARTFNGDRQSAVLRDKAVLKVVEALIPELDEMYTKLAAEAGQRG